MSYDMYSCSELMGSSKGQVTAGSQFPVADVVSPHLDACPQYCFSVSNLSCLLVITGTLNKDQQAIYSCAIIFDSSIFFTHSQSYWYHDTPSSGLLKPGTTSFQQRRAQRYYSKSLKTTKQNASNQTLHHSEGN